MNKKRVAALKSRFNQVFDSLQMKQSNINRKYAWRRFKKSYYEGRLDKNGKYVDPRGAHQIRILSMLGASNATITGLLASKSLTQIRKIIAKKTQRVLSLAEAQ